MDERAAAASSPPTDSGATPTPTPDKFSLVGDGGVSITVQQVAGKGRGLVVATAITTPGTVLLREPAAAWTVLTSADVVGAADPIAATARVAVYLLSSNTERLADHLEPTFAEFSAGHRARAGHADDIARGATLVTDALSVDRRATVPRLEIERLVLAVMLNAHSVVNPRGGPKAQALFPRMGAMLNHDDCPNAVVVPCRSPPIEASDGGGSQAGPWLEVRSIRPIEAAEEVTITYLDSLYSSFPERTEVLQQKYLFDATARPTDASLELLVPGRETDNAAIDRVVRANTTACAAYDRAVAGALFGEAGSAPKIAAQQYAAVLREGVLATTHAWHYNATTKLATLLTQTKSPVLCERALALWEDAIAASNPVWPSPLWPERRDLERGAAAAARIAGNTVAADHHTAELSHIEKTLGFAPP
jgi:hypothetical protein